MTNDQPTTSKEQTPFVIAKEKLDANTGIEVSSGFTWRRVYGVTVSALDRTGKPIHEPSIYIQFGTVEQARAYVDEFKNKVAKVKEESRT